MLNAHLRQTGRGLCGGHAAAAAPHHHRPLPLVRLSSVRRAAAAPGDAPAAPEASPAAPKKKRAPSSWTAKDARSKFGSKARKNKEGDAENGNGNRNAAKDDSTSDDDDDEEEAEDYLRALGTRSYTNTNVDAGQRVGMIDSLFAGKTLGHQTDIADGSLRKYEARSFANLCGDYFVSPRFVDKVASHVAKNYLADQGALGNAGRRVPLILGIWGPKGSGKTFQTELALKKLKAEPIFLSSGEMESDKAGEPGRVLRERYRRASELSKVRGVLSALVINDLDAGIGIFKETQRTVNNQIVGGTLMSICDNPNRVSIYGESWDGEGKGGNCMRIPIIVTGNDFSTLFAPLIRDGRMDKFYYDPDRDDKIAIVTALYRDDGLSLEDAGKLVDSFSRQSLDFFGAIRAATYDGQIREWLRVLVGGGELSDEGSDVKAVHRALLKGKGPVFEPVEATLEGLLAEGRRLVAEQELVNRSRLSEDYLKAVGKEAELRRAGKWRWGSPGIGLKG
jgi:hypothetical protein